MIAQFLKSTLFKNFLTPEVTELGYKLQKSKIIAEILKNQKLCFLTMGTLNAFITIGLYMIFNQFLNYQLAYFLAYVIGIINSYFLNSLFVFKVDFSLRKFIKFPIVYLVQYMVGVVLLEVLVQIFRVSAIIAPIFIVILTLPLTFILSRFVLRKQTSIRLN